MTKKCVLKITLRVKGPFITSGGTDAHRGIDRIFASSGDDLPVLRGSHIKGKLREALNELKTLGQISGFDIVESLGDEERPKSKIRFSDFFYNGSSHRSADQMVSTRIAIESKTGTAKEKNLQVIENISQNGAISTWKGEIIFWALDDTAARNIESNLIKGLKWITGLGGIKGSGFGQLVEVENKLFLGRQNTTPTPKYETLAHRTLGLAFVFNDDLFIGGVTRGTSFKKSRTIISGAVIKGALARYLNTLCGESKLDTSIDAHNTKVHGKFPELAENYSTTIFSHAFPVPPQSNTRPVTIPFSTLELGDLRYTDIAVELPSEDTYVHHSPSFRIDWKNPNELNDAFGWAKCQPVNKTRTAIDSQTRTAAENQLYTYQYISPTDDNSSKLRWLSHIRLPESLSIETATKLWDQLTDILYSGWCFLGKRDTSFSLLLESGAWEKKLPQHTGCVLVGKKAIVTLQTDALLFHGRRLAETTQNVLHQVYSEYWSQATEKTCILKRFYARQKMEGGYIARKYPTGPSYYPYILTEAGSVFVLEALNEGSAVDVLKKMQTSGLPLPEEIASTFTKQAEGWRQCPFVPENGYGEITINLNWHWEKQFDSNTGGLRK